MPGGTNAPATHDHKVHEEPNYPVHARWINACSCLPRRGSGGLRLTFVMNLLAYAKRVIGRLMRPDAMGHQPLPKRIASPDFCFDVLSSVAYAPDEAL